MARRKTFNSRQASTELIELDVNGTVFHALPNLPGAVLLDFVASADDDNAAAMVKAMTQLINQSIVPEELEAWQAFVREPANNVTIELIMEVASYLAEEYTGRPTQPSEQSSDGPVPIGPLRTVPPS